MLFSKISVVAAIAAGVDASYYMNESSTTTPYTTTTVPYMPGTGYPVHSTSPVSYMPSASPIPYHNGSEPNHPYQPHPIYNITETLTTTVSIPCASGTSCPHPHMPIYTHAPYPGHNITCPPGTHCPPSGHYPPNHNNTCPPGTYCPPPTGHHLPTHSTICPPGVECPPAHDSPCPSGLDCPPAHSSPCPPGDVCPPGQGGYPAPSGYIPGHDSPAPSGYNPGHAAPTGEFNPPPMYTGAASKIAASGTALTVAAAYALFFL